MTLLSSLMGTLVFGAVSQTPIGRRNASDNIEHLQKVFDRCSKAARIGVWECNLLDERLSWTDVVYELFDLEPGTPLVRDDILALYSSSSAAELNRLRRLAIEEHGSFTLDAEILTGRGNRRWIRITATVECEHDRPVRIFGLKQDITAEKTMLMEIQRRADFDHLTGLANRFQFQARLDILNGSDVIGTQTALLLVDLDGFKNVNDTLGHQEGDACLAETACRLGVATGDADFISRIGGDEFAVIYDGASREDVERAAARIVSSLRWTFREQVAVGASVGVAWTRHGMSPTMLYNAADKALYAAKLRGRNRYFLHPGTDTAWDLA